MCNMEQTNLFGQIDLTALGNIVRQHPQLVKEVTFKDGTVHKFINIDVATRQQASDKGHTHYIKVSCKKDQQVQGLKYYIADLKPSQYSNNQSAQPATSADVNDIPF